MRIDGADDADDAECAGDHVGGVDACDEGSGGYGREVTDK